MNLKDRIDKKYLKFLFYFVFTVLIGYLLIKGVDNFRNILGGIKTVLQWFNRIFIPLAWGIAIAYILFPVVRFFEKQLKKIPYYKKRDGSPRGTAVAVTVIIIVLFLFLFLSVLFSSVNRQISAVSFESLEQLIYGFAGSFDELYKMIRENLSHLNISSGELDQYLNDLSTQIGNILQGLGSSILGSFGNLQSFFTTAAFSIIFAIYFLIDGENLMAYWGRVFYALFGKKVSKGGKTLLKDADTVFAGYIRGQLADALFMAVVVSIALSIIGVKFSLLIGIATGIGNLIPYVGPFVAYVSTGLVCLMNGDFSRLIVALIVLFIIQTIDGNIVNPRLLSSNVDIHPVLVIISLLIGGAAAGFVGMLIGVPVGALLKMQFEKLIDWLITRRERPDTED